MSEKMNVNEAMSGCLMLCASASIMLLGIGGFVFLLSKSGCIGAG